MSENEKLDYETLKKACKEYENQEGRASFYDVALEIVNDHPLQASIILLAVWNINRFRFMASDSKNLVDLKKAITECKPLFERVKGKDFRGAKLPEIRDVVEKIYSKLSGVYGVEYTGASKVMHLLNRDLFVMWDRDTREKYGFDVADGDDYFNFLKLMQEKVKNIEWNDPNKTLAKAIDEYNQATITIPRMQERRIKKKSEVQPIPKSRNKYQKLEEYLRNSSKQIENLTYEDIERIIGTKLPSSAYKYRAWWSNSGQPHARTWSNVSWKVSSVNISKSVTFTKKF